MQAIETLENEPFYDHCRPVFGAPQVLQSIGQFRLQNQSSFEAVHLVQTLHLHTSGSARGGSGIPVYPKRIRQNTQKYPKFLPIFPKLIETLYTVYPKLVVAKQALILLKSYLYITPPTRNRRASFVLHLIENWQSVNPHWGRTVITFSR